MKSSKTVVGFEEGKFFAEQNNLSFFEVDAQSNTNLENIFSFLAKDILEKMSKKEKGHFINQESYLNNF